MAPQTGRIGGVHQIHRFEERELLFRERVEDGPQTALEERGLVGVLPAPHRRARRHHRIDQEREVFGPPVRIERIEAERPVGSGGIEEEEGFAAQEPLGFRPDEEVVVEVPGRIDQAEPVPREDILAKEVFQELGRVLPAALRDALWFS